MAQWKQISDNYVDQFYYYPGDDVFKVRFRAPCRSWFEKSKDRQAIEAEMEEYLVDDETFCWVIGRQLIENDDISPQPTSPPNAQPEFS